MAFSNDVEAASPSVSRGGAMVAPRPLALRVAGVVHGVAEHRLLDRLVRGRMWIAILAVGLALERLEARVRQAGGACIVLSHH